MISSTSSLSSLHVAGAATGTATIIRFGCFSFRAATATRDRDQAVGSAPHPTHDLGLVESAIDGDDRFERKREVIDEYGWRNFGDMYADHEAAFHTGPLLVSHYNNQYDVVYGSLLQFLRTGDAAWMDLFSPLARHVIDIDIYHTSQDKAAYNGGLFWHTDHYRDAATCTHRTYSCSNQAPGRLYGGGPCNEHNYTTGLMLHYFLTGSAQSRAAVIQLADWVIGMDDGARTAFRWIDSGPTGLASATYSMSSGVNSG